MLNTSGNMYIEWVQAQLCSGASRLHRRNKYFSNNCFFESEVETNELKRNKRVEAKQQVELLSMLNQSIPQAPCKRGNRTKAAFPEKSSAPKPNVREASLGCSWVLLDALAEA